MYKFYDMGNKPLKFPVYAEDGSIAIPAGTTGVLIAFNQSTHTRLDKAKGRHVRKNVYSYQGKLYHQ